MPPSSITNQLTLTIFAAKFGAGIEAPELSDDLSTTDRLTPVFPSRSTPLLRWDVF
jgi:hypothetical protein